MSFSGNYGGYGAREKIDLDQLLNEKVFNRFVAIFNDPQSLNPEKYRARVTREVADTLAKLARWLEKQGYEPKEVANFLMRCIFTMFKNFSQTTKRPTCSYPRFTPHQYQRVDSGTNCCSI
jgi:hypothetical protein